MHESAFDKKRSTKHFSPWTWPCCTNHHSACTERRQQQQQRTWNRTSCNRTHRRVNGVHSKLQMPIIPETQPSSKSPITIIPETPPSVKSPIPIIPETPPSLKSPIPIIPESPPSDGGEPIATGRNTPLSASSKDSTTANSGFVTIYIFNIA